MGSINIRLNRRTIIVLAVVIVTLSAALAAWLLVHRHSPKPATAPQATTPPATTAPKETDPLLIEEIRKRSYTASPVTVTQNLGSRGSYTAQVISFVSDGLTEYALQATPNGTPPPGGWPVVILCHGYIVPAQYQTTGSDYASWITNLTQNGYMVIKPDLRGHGSSQGVAEGGHFSPVYAYDVLNLIASLKQYSGVDASHLGLLGHSMGAHVALRVAVVSKDVKASAYVSGVVGSFYDIVFNWPGPPFVNDQPVATIRSRLNDLQQKHGDPKSNPEFWNQASAINYVGDITGPVQIHHGTADTVVPQLFSDHLAQALQTAHRPVEQFNYPGGDHQFSNANDRTIMLQRLNQLFGSTLRKN